jgi:hypothetical protein
MMLPQEQAFSLACPGIDSLLVQKVAKRTRTADGRSVFVGLVQLRNCRAAIAARAAAFPAAGGASAGSGSTGSAGMEERLEPASLAPERVQARLTAAAGGVAVVRARLPGMEIADTWGLSGTLQLRGVASTAMTRLTRSRASESGQRPWAAALAVEGVPVPRGLVTVGSTLRIALYLRVSPRHSIREIMTSFVAQASAGVWVACGLWGSHAALVHMIIAAAGALGWGGASVW